MPRTEECAYPSEKVGRAPEAGLAALELALDTGA